MDIIFRILLGASAGAAVGWLIGRMYLCHAAGCNVRARLIYSIIAGAVFGAGVAYALGS